MAAVELGGGSAALQSCGAGARVKGKKEEHEGLRCAFCRPREGSGAGGSGGDGELGGRS